MSCSRMLCCLVVFGLLCGTAKQGGAELPSYSVMKNRVMLAGVGPDNPIVYDNDWWSDVFDNSYLWMRAHRGDARLRGQIVTRDMWDWQKGYQYKMDDCVRDAKQALELARKSGLKNIPDLTLGADRVLLRPKSGAIEDTQAHESAGARLLIREALKATPERPLLVIAGGPLTTVANALLLEPKAGERMIVFNLTVGDHGYNGKDSWSVYIVAQRTRLVDWGTGSFWNRDSVFLPKHFTDLPRTPFHDDLRRLIGTDLGRANQLGDGAALVWLWDPMCWTNAKPRRAVWRDGITRFEPTDNPDEADLLEIPKAATDHERSRREFFRIIDQPIR